MTRRKCGEGMPKNKIVSRGEYTKNYFKLRRYAKE